MAKGRRYVYLIQRESDGLYKIGNSADPPGRTRMLSSRHGGRTVIHSFPCREAYRVEQQLHSYFDAKREVGEWFRLDEDDVRLICSLTAECVEELPEAIRDVPRLKQQHKGSSNMSPERAPLYVEIPHAMKAALEALAEKHGRKLREEFIHALTRHLSAPPQVIVIVPPLPPVEIPAPTGPTPKKPGRKPKAAPADEPAEPKAAKPASRKKDEGET